MCNAMRFTPTKSYGTELPNERYAVLYGLEDGEPMARIIGYERVSTARQGASGLGLEAQRQAIAAYADQRDAVLIARFTEVESGRDAERDGRIRQIIPTKPELARLIHERLSRRTCRRADRADRQLRAGCRRVERDALGDLTARQAAGGTPRRGAGRAGATPAPPPRRAHGFAGTWSMWGCSRRS